MPPMTMLTKVNALHAVNLGIKVQKKEKKTFIHNIFYTFRFVRKTAPSIHAQYSALNKHAFMQM